LQISTPKSLFRQTFPRIGERKRFPALLPQPEMPAALSVFLSSIILSFKKWASAGSVRKSDGGIAVVPFAEFCRCTDKILV
jgi:hypothetical protein